ncbi:hypothetical protein PVAG01_04272 [Phlyctema vagabunda]|uniref:Vacuolar ATPase assembly protein VMA22 n=1 Tax=Phlyctema vagabunda TaxID=108571 RepID=A0ABR4PNQ4_9HELO
MASPISISGDIDSLLERYLNLLDTYTNLRSELATLQSSVHQHIARANFSADRGIRYGQDLYDERMQASRACGITVAASSATFAVAARGHNAVADRESHRGTPAEEARPVESPVKKDPIRMFGILTPQSLRLAQSEATKMVEAIIPRIISTDAEMKDVEIQIRRARKHKAKAEAAEAKHSTSADIKTVVV